PQVRGWINYYGAFYRSELSFLQRRLNEHLVRWAIVTCQPHGTS
ncbi:MAG: group II intron maturase-specific domain-containing protein, partial [Mycobacterium sp.]